MKPMRLSVLFSLILAIMACENTTAPEIKNPPVITLFYAVPSTIDKGESSTLKWSTSGATTTSINQGVGPVAASGEKTVSPAQTTMYTLTATNHDGTVTASTGITVKEIAVMVLDGDPVKVMTSYGCPQFTGYVKNTGTVTGYNCGVEFRAYSDANRITIIDTAHGFPASLGDISPGQRAYYEATFFKLSSWDQVKSWDYKITWLNRNMLGIMEIFTTEGWGR